MNILEDLKQELRLREEAGEHTAKLPQVIDRLEKLEAVVRAAKEVNGFIEDFCNFGIVGKNLSEALAELED